MKTVKYLVFSLLLLIATGSLDAQRIKVEREALYGSKINVPVTIDVERSNGYVFYAFNESYYDYTIHLTITDIVNLTPLKVDQNFRVKPGRSRLIQLKVQDGSRRSDYRFYYTYSIGVKRGKVDQEFPYLIPLKSDFAVMTSDEAEQDVLPDYFKAEQGDTVYAARRGKIVATPDMYDGMDRISQNNAVEIQHADGTLMVYEDIDPENTFLKAGKEVFPGQPLGLLNEKGFLKLILYQSTGDGYLEALDIHYYVDDNQVETFSNKITEIPVEYPKSIITREFKRRELKQLEKGELEL